MRFTKETIKGGDVAPFGSKFYSYYIPCDIPTLGTHIRLSLSDMLTVAQVPSIWVLGILASGIVRLRV